MAHIVSDIHCCLVKIEVKCFSVERDSRCLLRYFHNAHFTSIANPSYKLLNKFYLTISQNKFHVIYYYPYYIAPLILDVLLNYLLTPWSRVLLAKLTFSQLVEKFPAVYGTSRLIATFTSARHLSLSWDRSIQTMLPHPIS